MTWKTAGRGRFRTLAATLVLATSAACRENLTAPPVSNGPDTSGPAVQLRPGRDTTADSTGILQVHVGAVDPSGIKSIEMLLIPSTFSFPSQAPLDTTYGAFYNVPLTYYKHSTFRYYVRAVDILDHETVTDTVTVVVR